MSSVLTYQKGTRNPFGNNFYPFYVLIEVASNNEGAQDSKRLFKLLENS